MELIYIITIISRVYNKEGGRGSYSSIVPCSAIVRVDARSMIFITCGSFTIYTTANCVASALGDYAYTASHNYTIDYTTHCEYH